MTIGIIAQDISYRDILKNISFSITAGEIVAIIGPNGAGKTTLLKIILGLVNGYSGKIEIVKDNQKLQNFYKSTIGYAPQSIVISNDLTMTGQYFLSIFAKEHRASEIYDLVSSALMLDRIMNKKLSSMSGGERQRLFLASAILRAKDLLIFDEPAQYLDIDSQSKFYNLISELSNKYRITIIMVSHDLFTVSKKANHVICVNNHLCCEGSPMAIGNNPVFDELFKDFNFHGEIGLYKHSHDHKHE